MGSLGCCFRAVCWVLLTRRVPLLCLLRPQPKIPDCTKDYLLLAEDQAKEKKANKQSELWDDKIKATQTESAFGLRCL